MTQEEILKLADKKYPITMVYDDLSMEMYDCNLCNRIAWIEGFEEGLKCQQNKENEDTSKC